MEIISNLSLELLCRLLSPAGAASDSLNEVNGFDQQAWEALMQTAKDHGVGLLLFQRLNTLKSKIDIPPAIFEPLQQSYYRAAAQTMLMQREAGSLLTSLKNQHLPVIALKGLYLSEYVYQDPGARIFGDLDLMVKKEHVPRALSILQTQGYQLETYFNDADPNQDIKHVPPMRKPGGPIVELHWTLLEENEPFTIDTSALWERAVPLKIAGVDALALSNEDLLLHLCLHAVYQHHLNLGLRGLMDIALVLHQYAESLDWQRVLRIAKSWKAERVLWLGLALVSKIFRVPGSEKLTDYEPDTDLVLKKAIQIIFSQGGEQSTMTPDLAALVHEQRLSKKIKLIFNRIFIPKIVLARLYKVDPRSPFIFLFYLKRSVDLFTAYHRSILPAKDKVLDQKQFADAVLREGELMNWLSHNSPNLKDGS